MKKIKSEYRPAAFRQSKKVAFTISSEHATAVDKSIERKTRVNKVESLYSWYNAKNYVVKGTDKDKTKDSDEDER